MRPTFINLCVLGAIVWTGGADTLITSMVIGTAQAGLFGPRNYDECITESLKGVTSDVAARAIIRSCREQFQDKELSERRRLQTNLSDEELTKINGRATMSDAIRSSRGHAGVELGPVFKCEIYNGNQNVILTEITLSITTKENDKEVAREYSRGIYVSPYETEIITLDIIRDEKDWTDLAWRIIGAKGITRQRK